MSVAGALDGVICDHRAHIYVDETGAVPFHRFVFDRCVVLCRLSYSVYATASTNDIVLQLSSAY